MRVLNRIAQGSGANFRRLLLSGVLLGALTAAIGLLFFATPFGASLEEDIGLAYLFRLRGAVAAPSDVVIVSTDKQSAKALGLPPLLGDWPRSVHARAIDALTERGAALIIFDMIFNDATTPEADAQLAASMRASGRVIFSRSIRRDLVPVAPSDDDDQRMIAVDQLVDPLRALREAALAVAPFPLPKLPARVSSFWAFILTPEIAPTLPAVTLQAYVARAFAKAESFPADFAGPAGASPDRVAAAMRRRIADNPDLAARLAGDAASLAPNAPNARLLGALARLYAKGDLRYLNLYGPPGTFRTISYARLLGGAAEDGADIGDLTGKVVFVGVSELAEAKQADAYPTVFTRRDGVDVSGVEIAATAFANLRDGTGIIRPSPGATLLILAGFGVAMGLASLIRKPVFAALLGCGLALAYLGAAYLGFATAHLWLPIVDPLFMQAPFALFAGLYLNLRRETEARASMDRTMRRYLPESVAREITRNRGRLMAGPQTTHGVCLATDAERFVAISESLAPDELPKLVSDYLQTIIEQVERRAGIVTDIRGDGTMCVWPTPDLARSVRLQACFAALGIRDAIDAFIAARPERGLRTRIGIDAGPIALGNVGGPGRVAYTVVGDVANTASRLENLNKHLGARLLASGAVVDGIDALLLRRLGSFKLAGKARIVEVAEILAARQAADASQAALVARFEAALRLFQQRQWQEAVRGFAALLVDFPTDGPAKFFLRQCEEFMRAPPQGNGPLVVEMGEK